MTDNFRLAVAQSPAELTSPRARVDWLHEALRDLQSKGVDLMLLPELFLTGYNIGDKVKEWAEPSDGPFAAEIAALAKRFGLAIHYGYAERADGVIYGASQCFGPDGVHLGSHRKLILPPGFEADHFVPGAGCSLFTYRGLRIGTLICYDAEFPETVRHVAMLGAELILVPTALGAQWGWVGRTLIPARAYENGVFLAYANQAGTENGMDYLGMSFIAAPDGEELARAGAASEILIADLDPSRVRRAQERLPYHTDRGRLKLA
ncbi:carbon-nitrogen hydrolase family protein [Defluviimonas sp. WL0075]|uniref:Carbon-nitrogen hydrolase family protein n=1 Tax=Albidovulum sediminicola TaxID=2984331 RepID=A0ABT2Z6F8_9RHOB|nr:carbon-nitrogen hydrolase family protein [Defluviimonas sp. WL0075]MCV2866728.1 carbon-nitrogen hydrolase family protein [Defluviimonas sp. WL0075]